MATHVNTGLAPAIDAYAGKTPTRLSWGAIFAGVVIAVAVQVVLGILGAGIGLTMVDPVEGTTRVPPDLGSELASTGSSRRYWRWPPVAMPRLASRACATGSMLSYMASSCGASR